MMAESRSFDFERPAEVPVSPTGEVPVSGSTPQSKHASYTGARVAVKVWTQKQSAYLQLLNQAEAVTDQEAATLLQWPLASVNSTRNGINAPSRQRHAPPLIVPDGFDLHAFLHPMTGTREYTRRTRWRIQRSP